MVSKNNQNLVDRIESAISHLVLKSTTSVPYDTILKLQEFQKQEVNNPIIHSQLSLMLENIDYGHHNQIPLCQDTG
ncbi:MAG: fumarate hydratase, partial [Promethearchaeota archaeon]